MADQDIAPELGRASSYDRLFTTSGATVILTGMLGRTRIKYQERAYRFMLLEAGHTAENILLAAASLDLAATPVGGFIDDEVAAILDIDGVDEVVVELIPVGTAPNEPGSVQPSTLETEMLAMLWPH
jgi:SagB-type dehydrogenase family enzyme